MSDEKEAKNDRKESESQTNQPAEPFDRSPSAAFAYINKKKENKKENYDNDADAAFELYLHLNETDRLLVLERMKSLLKKEK